MATEEDVRVIEQVLAAWNRRDLDALLALTDPDARYLNSPEAIEPGTRRGHDQLARAFRSQWEGLANSRQEIERTHARGEEIITEGRLVREMPGSDARLANRILLSWTVRDGRVTRLQLLGAGSTSQRALEAAGLSE